MVSTAADPSLPVDDSNPFAFQPPSPSRLPVVIDNVPPIPKFVEKLPIPFHRTSPRRMNLSSIPFAPPKFVEPIYEEQYQDVIMPLNDFNSKNPAYLADDIPSGLSLIMHTPTSIAQLSLPQQMSSPLFLSDVYPPSLAFTTPLNTDSSSDLTSPTPMYNNTITPEKDEIKEALETNHSFVTSVYASSPAGSFRGFPLDTLIGSRSSSPYAYSGSASDFNGMRSTPSPIPQPIWVSSSILNPVTCALNSINVI
jgi:hypothetical protein